MRINCPLCGARDHREFYYRGDALALDRPPEGDGEAMHRYLHIRENPTGRARELWYHEAGCTSWLIVERDRTTHEIFDVTLAAGRAQ